jgi:hypothetical protein
LLRVAPDALLHAVAVVLTVVGFLLIVGAQLAPPVDFSWLRLGTVLGGLLAAAGGALLWRAPRFPLVGRLLAPALPLALVGLWDGLAANSSGSEGGGFTFVASGDWYSYYSDSFTSTPTASTLQFPSYFLLALAVLCLILAAITFAVRNAQGLRR